MAASIKRILVVDDEKALARVMEYKLTHEGFEAKTAFNGEEALSVLEKGQFDLVVLDLMMPKKNGYEVLEELRAKKNSIPAIVTSNLGQKEDLARATSLGAVKYFVKADVPLDDIIKFIKDYFK